MLKGRKLDEIGVGLGPTSIPYSQVPQEDPLMGMLNPQQQAAAAAAMNVQPEDEEGQAPPPAAPAAPSGLLGAPGAGAEPMSSDLTDQDLASMGGQSGGQPPAAGLEGDPQVAAVIAALENPNTPPEMRQRIETMIALSARRSLAGL